MIPGMKKSIAWIMTLVFVLVSTAGCSSPTPTSPTEQNRLSEKDANATLASWLTKINVGYNDPPIDLDTSTRFVEEMPNIDSAFPFSVDGSGQVDLEIWVSTERSGSGNDGWVNRVTENFNKSNLKLADGRGVSVSIRSIDAGAQLDYLTLTDIRPDAWSPANGLWNEMALSRGIQSELALERSVGNTAGILMKKSAYDSYMTKHQSLELSELIDAAIAEELVLGFTNPYTSDTALNMLTQILKAIDPDNPLGAEAAQKFLEFQKFAPPPAYTTAQMRESAKKGFIDVMVMECQAYSNEPTLADYVFTPFGVRHDNPVYTFADVLPERREALALWCQYIANSESQRIGDQYGFNKFDDYVGDTAMNGNELYSAQSLWKENKSGGKPTVAVFVTDVSGSMAGVRINNLKDSLLNSMQYIGEENYIGLVSFSDNVTVELPIDKLQGTHRAKFQGAVKGLQTGGNTHMYSALLVAIDMLREHKSQHGDANYMVFVLTDGETNGGVEENICAQLVVSYGMPIHTIGYGNDISPETLTRLASYAEGFCIAVSVDDVIYHMKNMFNSQM